MRSNWLTLDHLIGTPEWEGLIDRGARSTVVPKLPGVFPPSWEWDVSGVCTDPIQIEASGFSRDYRSRRRLEVNDKLTMDRFMEAFWFRFDRNKETPYPTLPVRRSRTVKLNISILAPCRRCDSCKEARRKLWAARAIAEALVAKRTWKATFTLRPSVHQHWIAEGIASSIFKYEDDDGNSRRAAKWQRSDFEHVNARAFKELTLWLKRIRKASGAQLRFMLVTEEHSQKLSGLPHWHMLIHETTFAGVTWEELTHGHYQCRCFPGCHDVVKKVRLMENDFGPFSQMYYECSTPHTERHRSGLQWRHGHSKFELMEMDGNPAYLTKYLAKDARAKIRASKNYGLITIGT